MSVIGLFIGAFEFYLFSLNRKEYYKILDEYDDLRKPMMNATMSMTTINSRHSGGPHGGGGHASGIGPQNPNGHLINFGPHPVRQLNMSQRINTPSIGGNSSIIGGNMMPQIDEQASNSNFVNPLQNIHNQSGRFRPFVRNGQNTSSGNNNTNKPVISTPSDRGTITTTDSDRIIN